MSWLAPLAPVLLAAGLPVLAALTLGTERPAARLLILAPAMLFTLRYLTWRWGGALPEGGPAQAVWGSAFLVFETLGGLGSLLMCLTLMHPRDRRREAAAPAPAALRDAPVDVFICTYNEDREILERTIVCALHIAHADLRVWVLDDGARPWVRDIAEDLGACYLHRVRGRHAKAGNINNALEHALRSGRPPAFVLFLDADFTAHRDILRRTLPLFREPDVGIVQTPQHFFNNDPVQHGLLVARAWPDEQRFFFNHLMPGKDAWGAAFCCGTSAVVRVAALRAAGGMPTDTVTEDMLASFKLQELGWRTVFLNERLSAGLAPESLSAYVVQRSRWCLGNLQQMYTRWSFIGPARLPLAQRLAHLDSFLYWAFSFPARLLVLAAPAAFWWFGLAVFDAGEDAVLGQFVPATLGCIVSLGLVSRWRLSPLLSDVSQLLIAWPMLAVAAQVLVRPFGRPFRVTPKGQSSTGVTVHWGLLAPHAVLLTATATGLLANAGAWSAAREADGYSMQVIWSLFTIVLLAAVIACCVEPPRPRQEERFATSEPAEIRLADGRVLHVRCLDLATRGARTGWAGPAPARGTSGELRLDGGRLRLPFEILRAGEGDVAMRLFPDTATRRALIAKLYTGAYSNETEEVALAGSARGVMRRILD